MLAFRTWRDRILKYPYFLLKELEIPYMMVVDKDVFLIIKW